MHSPLIGVIRCDDGMGCDDGIIGLHGGREAATGRGVVFATRELLKASGAGLIADKTFVIQARCPWPPHADPPAVLPPSMQCCTVLCAPQP
jgi:hypothetical protein